jgi:hypothetical protein
MAGCCVGGEDRKGRKPCLGGRGSLFIVARGGRGDLGCLSGAQGD